MKENLKVHLLSNELFLYCDGSHPKRLIRDWLFDPSILLLHEILVDKAQIKEEEKFRDRSITSDIICRMVRDGIIKTKNFGEYFTKGGIKKIEYEINQMIKTKSNRNISIVRNQRDVLLKRAGKSTTTILNSELRQEEIRNFGTSCVFVPALELFPDLNKNIKLRRMFKRKTPPPEEWDNRVWKQTEENYNNLLEWKENEGIQFMREKVRAFAHDLGSDKEKAIRNFKRDLDYIYTLYTKPESFSGKFKLIKGISWTSSTIAGLIGAIWRYPRFGLVTLAKPLFNRAIHEVHRFKTRKEYKDDYGWFFWFYDVSMRLRCQKLKSKISRAINTIWKL